MNSWKETFELIALVAVVGSLVTVAAELRQTQAALEAQTYQERAFDAIDFQLAIATNPELNLIFLEEFDRDSLSAEQYTVAINMLYAIMIDADNEHYQYQRGFLEEDFYLADTVPKIMKWAPVWRDFDVVESRRDFTEEVDRLLASQSGN